MEETLLVPLLAIPPAPPAPLLLEAPPAEEVDELLLDTAEPLDATTVVAPVYTPVPPGLTAVSL